METTNLHLDNLEPRKTLASASFADGHLEVIGTAGNDIIGITVSVSNQVRVLANN